MEAARKEKGEYCPFSICFRVQGLGCRMQGAGRRVWGWGCRVQGLESGGWGAGFRVRV